MPGPEIAPNFSNMSDVTTIVYDAEAVPVTIWNRLQSIHRDSLRSHVPQGEWGRMDEIVSWGQPARYRETRINPNILVHEGIWNPQLFKDVLVAVTFDHTHQPVGGVITENNTSASAPRLAREKLQLPLDDNGVIGRTERRIKMHLPTWVPFPYIGGKRIVHFREGYVHPDVQPEINWGEQTSGFILAGLVVALEEYRARQLLAAYAASHDPADTELTQTVRLINARKTGDQSHQIPGYDPDEPLTRLQENVADALSAIDDVDTGGTLRSVRADRFTAKQARKVREADEKKHRKQDREAFWAEQDSKHFIK